MNAEEQTPALRPQTKRTALLGVGIAVMLGLAGGLGCFTFIYAHGSSYLGNDPKACANCHIMREQLDAYIKSSHRSVATCNDCHTPPGLVAKYFTKAEHGFFHSLAFTTGNFHEPIEIKERSRRVTETACRKCHQELVHQIDLHGPDGQAMSCIRCHASVGHPNRDL